MFGGMAGPGSRATPAGIAIPPTGAMRTSAARWVVDRRTVLAVRDGTVSRRQDALAGEEPMEIRVKWPSCRTEAKPSRAGLCT